MVIDVYVVIADGVWLYEPKAHTLLPHLKDDVRAQTGLQDFVAGAPLNLVYVAHGERMTDVSAEDGVSTPRSMPHSSARTSIYTALRRGWQRSFAAR